MKKILLSIITLFSVYSAQQASAQAFSVTADTIFATVGGAATVNNMITNNTAAGFKITWSVDTTDFPTDWLTASAFGICDNSLCRQNDNHAQLWNDTTKTATSFVSFNNYMPGVPGSISLSLSFATVSVGSHYVVMNVASPTYSRKIVFVINKVPVAVPAAPKPVDEVVMYPNPATNELNVVYDAASDIKNIAVYNIIGKVMTVYKVTGASANLNIESMPSGVYFARFYNAVGNVVATKKFTKQ